MHITHKGIEIRFSAHDGMFRAAVAGEHVKKQTLAAMKKHIDNTNKVQFTPFTVLVSPDYIEGRTLKSKVKYLRGTHLVRVKVIGARAVREGYGSGRQGRMCFVVKVPGEKAGPYLLGRHADILQDTPEVLAAYTKARAFEEETSIIDDCRTKEQRRLDDACIEISPEAYRDTKASAS